MEIYYSFHAIKRFIKISCTKNTKNNCVIAKSSTVKSLILEHSIIASLKRYGNVWKRYFSDTLSLRKDGYHVVNVFESDQFARDAIPRTCYYIL